MSKGSKNKSSKSCSSSSSSSSRKKISPDVAAHYFSQVAAAAKAKNDSEEVKALMNMFAEIMGMASSTSDGKSGPPPPPPVFISSRDGATPSPSAVAAAARAASMYMPPDGWSGIDFYEEDDDDDDDDEDDDDDDDDEDHSIPDLLHHHHHLATTIASMSAAAASSSNHLHHHHLPSTSIPSRSTNSKSSASIPHASNNNASNKPIDPREWESLEQVARDETLQQEERARKAAKKREKKQRKKERARREASEKAALAAQQKREKLILSWRSRVVSSVQALDLVKLQSLLKESPLWKHNHYHQHQHQDQERPNATSNANNSTALQEQDQPHKHMEFLLPTCIAKSRQQQHQQSSSQCRLKLAAYILQHASIDIVFTIGRTGRNSLHIACFMGDVDFIQFVFKQMSSQPSQYNSKDHHFLNITCQDSGWAPLHYAVLSGSKETVEVILRQNHPSILSTLSDETQTSRAANDKGITALELAELVLSGKYKDVLDYNGSALDEVKQEFLQTAQDIRRYHTFLRRVIQRLSDVQQNGYSNPDGEKIEPEQTVSLEESQPGQKPVVSVTVTGTKKKKKKKKKNQASNASTQASDVTADASPAVAASSAVQDDPLITALLGMGFTAEQIHKAAKACGGTARATADDLVAKIFEQESGQDNAEPSTTSPSQDQQNEEQQEDNEEDSSWVRPDSNGQNADKNKEAEAIAAANTKAEEERRRVAAQRQAAKREEQRRRNREWNNREQARQREEAKAKLQQAAQMKARQDAAAAYRAATVMNHHHHPHAHHHPISSMQSPANPYGASPSLQMGLPPGVAGRPGQAPSGAHSQHHHHHHHHNGVSGAAMSNHKRNGVIHHPKSMKAMNPTGPVKILTRPKNKKPVEGTTASTAASTSAPPQQPPTSKAPPVLPKKELPATDPASDFPVLTSGLVTEDALTVSSLGSGQIGESFQEADFQSEVSNVAQTGNAAAMAAASTTPPLPPPPPPMLMGYPPYHHPMAVPPPAPLTSAPPGFQFSSGPLPGGALPMGPPGHPPAPLGVGSVGAPPVSVGQASMASAPGNSEAPPPGSAYFADPNATGEIRPTAKPFVPSSFKPMPGISTSNSGVSMNASSPTGLPPAQSTAASFPDFSSVGESKTTVSNSSVNNNNPLLNPISSLLPGGLGTNTNGTSSVASLAGSGHYSPVPSAASSVTGISAEEVNKIATGATAPSLSFGGSIGNATGNTNGNTSKSAVSLLEGIALGGGDGLLSSNPGSSIWGGTTTTAGLSQQQQQTVVPTGIPSLNGVIGVGGSGTAAGGFGHSLLSSTLDHATSRNTMHAAIWGDSSSNDNNGGTTTTTTAATLGMGSIW